MAAAADERDIDIAHAYGVRHPTVFGGIWVNGPRIYFGLTQTDPYADELRALMAAPDDLHIESVQHTVAELQALQDQISQRVRRIPGMIQSIGIQPQRLVVGLSAAGSELAAQLHEEFGDLLRISVGGRGFPPEGTDVPPRSAPHATREFPGLVITAHLETDQVSSGAGWSGEVELHNTGSDLIAFDTGQPVLASVVSIEDTVVGSFSGWIAGTGLRIRLEPGASRMVRFLGGTSGGSGEQYSTSPGVYSAVVVIPVYDGEPGGQVVSTPTDLRIT